MIESISEGLGGVPDAVVYLVLVLGTVQIAVQVWALVDLARIKQVAGGRKWLWALAIILLSNLALGAILYFAIGRRVPQEIADSGLDSESSPDRTAAAVDALYGPGDGVSDESRD